MLSCWLCTQVGRKCLSEVCGRVKSGSDLCECVSQVLSEPAVSPFPSGYLVYPFSLQFRHTHMRMYMHTFIYLVNYFCNLTV